MLPTQRQRASDAPPRSGMLEAAPALLALALDAAIGDPRRLYARVPHPVVLLGALIARVERALDPLPAGAGDRGRRGALLVAVVVTVAVAVALGLEIALEALLGGAPGGQLVPALAEGLLASTLIACRGLHEYVDAVRVALARPAAGRLAAARDAVSHIVGRDPRRLDEYAIARASLESLAENWADGVVAPLFWYAVFGLPGLVAYKAVNTMDSMLGYRSARHLAFGRAAARLDDWVNWPAARLGGWLLAVAALLAADASARRAITTMLRDAVGHRSPNAGWPEAAMAGALGFRLAGPRDYASGRVNDPWMGDGWADLGADEVARGLRLYRMATLVLGVLLAVLAVWLSQ